MRRRGIITLGGAIRPEQIADLLAFIQRTRRGTQTIVMGDFNASPDWPELEPLDAVYTDTFALFVEDPLSETHATLNHHVGVLTRFELAP